MKKPIKIILSILLVIVITFLFKKVFFDKDAKEEIFILVNENYELLLSDVVEQDFSDSLNLSRIESVDIAEEGIDFYCGGFGIAPSSHDYGFYYTEDNLPKAIWCGTMYCDTDLLKKDGEGYSTDYQYNRYYTEKIRDNFYYYEAHF